jgi:hypothetical protein
MGPQNAVEIWIGAHFRKERLLFWRQAVEHHKLEGFARTEVTPGQAGNRVQTHNTSDRNFAYSRR